MNIFKKTLYVLPITLLFGMVILLFPTNTYASSFYFNSFTLKADETIEENLYVVGEEIKIDGIVNGDAILLGDVIEVNGTITGDMYLIGGKIDIDANVYGTTFLFGNNTTLEGLIAKNTYAFSAFLNYNADTGEDLFAFFLESSLKGSVGDDLRAFGIRSKIDSIVSGDLLILANQYNAQRENVTGDIYNKVDLQNMAKDQGVEIDEPIIFQLPTVRPSWELRFLNAIIGFSAMLLVGFIIILMTPVKTFKIQSKITGTIENFVVSFSIGFLLFLILPLPLLILLISVIGTPTALLLISILVFIIIFGRIWVETALGREILSMFGVKEYRPFKSFLVGRVLSIGINFIPVVSMFYNLILVFTALGAVVRMKREYYTKANEQALKLREKATTKKTTTKTSKKK